MIFTTDNNDTPTIHFVAIICQGSSMSGTGIGTDTRQL